MGTADILFQYLKNIIYNPENAHLDLEQLPQEFQKLGQGMQLLGKWMKENKKFSLAMAKGDLSYSESDQDNVLIFPMKELQGMLRHLAWQTQQVAKGDYSQTVDFMGEFSNAFNTMTKQLEERREALFAEKLRVEKKSEELEQSFELTMAIANYTQNMIFIYSADEHRELFKNKSAELFLTSRPQESEEILENLRIKEKEEITANVRWDFEICPEVKLGEIKYFHVESYPIIWQQKKAFIHIVLDDTERKKKENSIYQLAYLDELTGLHNQRYAMEKMEKWIKTGVPFVLSFVDVDYLKYCNDTYGHKKGDGYLLEIAHALKTLGGVLCRTGGDEFMVMRTEKTVREQDHDLEQVRAMIYREGNRSVYPRSFSYASCDVPADPGQELDEYIMRVDSLMYKYKTKNKKPLKDVLYRDDRKLGE